MNTERNVAIAVIVVALLLGLSFYLNIRNQDINFTRRTFAALIKGQQSAQNKIDWANFQAMGVNAGQTYSGLPNDKERADYRRAFISNFALPFRQARIKLNSFINWRLVSGQDAHKSIVAVGYKGIDKTLLFTISKDRRKKLTAIQWE